MDPYLESPYQWQSIHPQLVAGLPAVIEPGLPERYAVSVEEHVYLTVPGDTLRLRRPDAMGLDLEREPAAGGGATTTVPRAIEVVVAEEEPAREYYLTIQDLEAADEVVTVIEVLSPTNKLPGPGRDEYLSKRGAVLASRTNLVEIDLLRYGPRMPAAGAPAGYQYEILVRRGAAHPRAHLLPFSVREPIPPFPLPLRPGDAEPPVDLAPALASIYRTNRLSRRIDYRRPPEPPLSPEDEAWADTLLRERGVR
jgi:hypothetical protein